MTCITIFFDIYHLVDYFLPNGLQFQDSHLFKWEVAIALPIDNTTMHLA